MTPTTRKSKYVPPVIVLLLFVTNVLLYSALITLTWTRADLVEPTVVKTFMTAIFLVPIAMAALVVVLFEKWVRANKKIVALGGKP